MQFIRIITSFSAFCALVSVTNACKGCVNLDEYNFEKIVPRFNSVLVKFDVAYPYGDKHDVFVTLASEIVDNNNIILAEVGVKDYGEKDNEGLAKKFGIKGKDDLPAIRLFVQGQDEPINFPQKSDWTSESLKQFIRDNTDIYLGLSGCLEQFDKLAMKFVSSGNRENIFKQAETETKKLTSEKEKTIASTYLKFMKKILDSGMLFVQQEVARLAKIIKEGKINDMKKIEFSNRLNILKSFTAPKTEL